MWIWIVYTNSSHTILVVSFKAQFQRVNSQFQFPKHHPSRNNSSIKVTEYHLLPFCCCSWQVHSKGKTNEKTVMPTYYTIHANLHMCALTIINVCVSVCVLICINIYHLNWTCWAWIWDPQVPRDRRDWLRILE